MRIGKITTGAEYRMDENSRNFLIFGTDSFPNSENLLILLFGKFPKFPIYRITKISNFEN